MNTATLPCDISESDNDIIKMVVAGESGAFRTLYRKHEKKVRSAVRNMCGDELLDDLVQEIFIRVWKNLGSFRGDSNFTTWLFRIVHNVVMDCRKAYATKKARMQELIDTQVVLAESEKVSNSDDKEVVKELLEALDFEHRQVLVLVDLEEFSLQEAADIIGIPLGTVKSRVYYARIMAKEYLIKKGVSYES